MRSDQDPDENFTSWIAVEIALTRATHQTVPQIVSMTCFTASLPPKYKAIRQVHLERGEFELADIRRMIAAIYADNLARHVLIHSEVLREVVPPCRQ